MPNGRSLMFLLIGVAIGAYLLPMILGATKQKGKANG